MLVCKPAMDCAAAKQCIINPKVPDLTVNHSASSPTAGQIRYQATVCNNGSGAAPTFRVHFYRNRSNAPTAGEYGDKTYQFSGLAAGERLAREETGFSLRAAITREVAARELSRAALHHSRRTGTYHSGPSA